MKMARLGSGPPRRTRPAQRILTSSQAPVSRPLTDDRLNGAAGMAMGQTETITTTSVAATGPLHEYPKAEVAFPKAGFLILLNSKADSSRFVTKIHGRPNWPLGPVPVFITGFHEISEVASRLIFSKLPGLRYIH